MDKAFVFATVLFHIVALILRYFHPVLRPWIVTGFKYSYRYVLLPYSTFWLDHFYILCGVVTAYMFYYLIRVFPSKQMMNPFWEGCGDGENDNPYQCVHDPLRKSKRQPATDVQGECTPCLLTHYVGEFRKKLTKQNVDDLRERLHQKGVLDVSDMDELHQHLTSNMTVQLSVMFSKLCKKSNGYDVLIEAMKELDVENHNSWFGDLAKELMIRFCQECRKRYPKGYPTLLGIEFFMTKTFSISSESVPATNNSNTTTSIKWQEHGINISFPKCCTQAEVTIGVSLNGHFKLPPETELVSPVYNITTAGILNKPISVELRHNAVLKTSTDEALLNFVKVELPNDDENHDGVYNEYKMNYYTHDETCFSRYGSLSGTTVIPPSDTPIQSFLLAVVKSKGKWFKVFSRDLQCLYRLQVFYSRLQVSESLLEWEATVVATKALPSYTEVMKGEFPSDRFSFGSSSVVCLGENGLSIELPKKGEFTEKKWKVTPSTNSKITRHQIDYPSANVNSSTLISPSINLKLKWFGRLLVVDSDQYGYIPELEYALVTKGTRKPYVCDSLPLYFKPEPQVTENDLFLSASSDDELPFNEEDPKSEIDQLSATGLKFNVWEMLNIFKMRVRIFVSLSMEVSVPGAYVNVPYVPGKTFKSRKTLTVYKTEDMTLLF